MLLQQQLIKSQVEANEAQAQKTASEKYGIDVENRKNVDKYFSERGYYPAQASAKQQLLDNDVQLGVHNITKTLAEIQKLGNDAEISEQNAKFLRNTYKTRVAQTTADLGLTEAQSKQYQAQAAYLAQEILTEKLHRTDIATRLKYFMDLTDEEIKEAKYNNDILGINADNYKDHSEVSLVWLTGMNKFDKQILTIEKIDNSNNIYLCIKDGQSFWYHESWLTKAEEQPTEQVTEQVHEQETEQVTKPIDWEQRRWDLASKIYAEMENVTLESSVRQAEIFIKYYKQTLK